MKKVILFGLLSIYAACAFAQAAGERRINFKTFQRDSVNLPYNEDYYLIEDSCALIIRYGHYDFDKKIFFGPVKDVSKLDNKLIVSEGSYTAGGLKDGLFTLRYLNGQLEAKGRFKDNNYDGPWELYYDNGKPRLTFEANNGVISISSAWNLDGTKTVANGNGTYAIILGSLSWKGKLFNGKPDGNWKLIKTDYPSQDPMITESFKKGEFKKGVTQYAEYTDKTHIVLISPDLFPFFNSEKMLGSAAPCNGTQKKHIIGVRYREGWPTFNQYIKDLVSEYFKDINYRQFNNRFTIEGDVSEKGNLVNLVSKDAFRQDIARGLIIKLKSLPVLDPATADGKAITQKFQITFTFEKGFYSFSYNFLPIKQAAN